MPRKPPHRAASNQRHAFLLTLVASAVGALGLNWPGTASAQTVQAAERAFDVDLPAQPLAQALAALSRQTGVQVFAGGELVSGRAAPAVKGRLSLQQALDRLLAGSGLMATTEGAAVVLKAAPPASSSEAVLPAVRATASAEPLAGERPAAYVGGQVARGGRVGLLGNVDVMDTPFNSTAYTAQLIADQQARTLADVFANDPSIRASTPGADNYNIRGFGVNRFGNTSFDGLYGVAPSFGIRLEGIERVEVLKGPAAFLNGLAPFGGGLGGAINLVPKRAGEAPLTRLTATYESDSLFGAHLDIGRRFGEDNSLGVRGNLSWKEGDTAIDGQRNREAVGTLGLDYRSASTRLSFDIGRTEEPVVLQQRTFSVATDVIPLPGPPSNKALFSQPYEYQKRDSTYGTIRGEWDASDRLTLGAAYGRVRENDSVLITFQPRIVNAQGDATVGSIGQVYIDDSRSSSAEISARYRASFLGANHTVAVVANTVRSMTRFDDAFAEPNGYTFNIYDRASLPSIPDPGLSPTSLIDEPWAKRSGLAVSDVISTLDDRLIVMLGARYQKVDDGAGYEESAVTPALGLVVKPARGVSLYANYVEALSPGTTVAAGFNNRGEVFPPYKGKQYELGSKVDWGRFATTVSVFQITQPSLITDNSTTPLPTRLLAGEQRNRGIELQTFGEIVRGVRVLGGTSYTQAKLTKTQGGTNNGNTAPNVPKWLVNLGGEWDLPGLPGLTLSARAIHTSSTYLTATNTQVIPAWTQYDVGLRYATAAAGKPVVLRANVENATDRLFWQTGGAGAGTLTLSNPRTLALSATVDF